MHVLETMCDVQAEEKLRQSEEKQKQEMIRMYFALQSCNATLQGRIVELEDSEQKLKVVHVSMLLPLLVTAIALSYARHLTGHVAGISLYT